MKHKLIILMGVVGIVYVTSYFPIIQTNATITAPTNYDYSYRQSNIHLVDGNNWAIRNNGGSTLSILPTYTSTYDGQYYSYSSTVQLLSNDTGYFDIDMIFNRSTTSWTQVSGSIYRPTNNASYIGSNNAVGIFNKFSFVISNQTSHDYLITFDTSSTGATLIAYQNYNNSTNVYTALFHSSLTQNTHFIPSFSTFNLDLYSYNNVCYFDAFYIDDLGVADAYSVGNDVGFNDGYDVGLNDGYDDGYDTGFNDAASGTQIESIFNVAFGAVASIFSVHVFPGITLGTIIIAPTAFALLWVLLGIVGGIQPKGKK